MFHGGCGGRQSCGDTQCGLNGLLARVGHSIVVRETFWKECVKTSLFEIFKIGIGPSSSHTVGPMRAAAAFAAGLRESGVLGKVARVEANLYGSLALTGHGHGTDRAVLLGLSGELPDRIAPESIEPKLAGIRAAKELGQEGEPLLKTLQNWAIPLP